VKKIYSIAAVNVKVLLSDRSAMLWLLAMPIVFTFVSGIVFSGGGGGDDGAPVRYALTVANTDEGARGDELLEAMERSDEIDLLMLEGPRVGDEARLLVESGERSAALVIPRDFSEKLNTRESVQLKFHRNPERMNPLVTRQAVERVVARLNAEELAGRAVVSAHEVIRGVPETEPWFRRAVKADRSFTAWQMSTSAPSYEPASSTRMRTAPTTSGARPNVTPDRSTPTTQGLLLPHRSWDQTEDGRAPPFALLHCDHVPNHRRSPFPGN